MTGHQPHSSATADGPALPLHGVAGSAKLAGAVVAPQIAADPIAWRSVFRWAMYVVRLAPAWVALETALTLGLSLATMYTFLVLGSVISALQHSGSCAGSDCGAGPVVVGIVPLPQNGRSAVIVFATLTILLIVGGFGNRVLGSWISNKMIGRLRQDVHDRLLMLGPSFLDQFPSGRSILLITSYVSNAQMMLKEVITAPIIRGVSLVSAIFLLGALLSALQSQDRSLHVVMLAGLVGLPIVGWFLAARLRVAFGRAVDSQMHLTDEFLNSTSKPDEIQLMAAWPQRSKAFAARIGTLTRDQFNAEWGRELANTFQTAIPSLLQILLLLYGVFIALESGSLVAAGAIVALYQLVPQAISPIQQLLQIYAAFTASWPQLKSVIDILEAEPEGGREDGSLEIGAEDRSVTFDHVSFGYAPGRAKIVDDLSYSFPVGKVTAIVARFGVGKSTLLSLMARQRRPQSGAISIGDKPIDRIKRASLRGNVVKVSQFPLFITDTARENFRLAKADVTDAEIEAVSRETGFWSVLVKETPAGGDPLNYKVSRQDGVGLSGGQRRMLAVTRALLLKPTVLLLDEPTTGIDPIGRHEVCETLVKACAGLTVIVVDQDMNFIQHFAQMICCLENATFTDIGSPAELLARPSLFAKLSDASTH